MPGPVGQPDQVEQLGDPAAALRPGRTPRGRLVKRPSAGGGQGALHVLGRRQGGDEVELLEHEPEGGQAQVGQAPVRQGGLEGT